MVPQTERLLRVISAIFTVRNPLPVYPDNQTFSEALSMSQGCHQRT